MRHQRRGFLRRALTGWIRYTIWRLVSRLVKNSSLCDNALSLGYPRLNPPAARVIALEKPTDQERGNGISSEPLSICQLMARSSFSTVLGYNRAGIMRRVLGQAGVFALIQFVILLIWSRAGMMLNAFFQIETGEPATIAQFLLFASLIGAIFAALTFAMASFSLPMIAHRDVNMVTACVSSINAVLRNKWVPFQWAILIVLLTLVGFVTCYLGLIVISPWLAYACWHADRETLDDSSWPKLQYA